MGEGWGEGEYSAISCTYVPLPFIPSSPRRRLYEPEATRGGEMGLLKNPSRQIRS